MKRGLAKRSLIYLASNATNKAIPILVIFLVSHRLSIADFGNISLFITISAILLPAMSFNAFMGLDRTIPLKGIRSQSAKAEINDIRNLILVSHGLLLPVCALATWLGTPSSKILFAATAYSLPFSITFLSLQIFKNTESPYRFAINAICCNGIILLILGSASLVQDASLVRIFSINGVLAVYVLAATLSALASSVINPDIRTLPLCLSIRRARKTLLASTPFFLHASSAVIINFSDKLIIIYFLTPADLGLYTVAYTIGMSISLIQDSFHKMYGPWIMKQYSDPQQGDDLKAKELGYTLIFGLSLIAASVILTYLASIIANKFLSQSFEIAPMMVVTIGLGYAANGVLRFFIPRIMFLGRMRSAAIILVANSFFGVALNLVLVPTFGIWGAAITTVISFSLTSAIIYIYWTRNYSCPNENGH